MNCTRIASLAILLLFITPLVYYLWKLFFSKFYDSLNNTEQTKIFFSIYAVVICLLALIPFLIDCFLFDFDKLQFNLGDYYSCITIILGIPSILGIFITSNNFKKDSVQNQNTKNKIAKFEISDERVFTKEETFYFFKLSDKKLLIADYLENKSGDNLWNFMNAWYLMYKNIKTYKAWPLTNASSNNWEGNEEWAEQLKEFIDYLKTTNQIIED